MHHDMMRDTFEAVHRDAGEVVGCENEAPAPRVRREARERYCSHCHRGLGAPLRQGSRAEEDITSSTSCEVEDDAHCNDVTLITSQFAGRMPSSVAARGRTQA